MRTISCDGLLLNGYVAAEWGVSENNRHARYYTLTAARRKQLAVERQEFNRMILSIHRVHALREGPIKALRYD